MKNETKNTLVKSASSIWTIFVYVGWILSIALVVTNRNPGTLLVMGIMTVVAIAAIVENARIQSRADLFDESENLPKFTDFLEDDYEK